MNKYLYNYDVFPRVVLQGIVSDITIKPLGKHVAFVENKEYRVDILPLTQSKQLYDNAQYRQMNLIVNTEGNLLISNQFDDEQEFYIRLYDSTELIAQFSIYALNEDLFALRPYRGDLHVHTHKSDGTESGDIVASYYRKHGFDFVSITDHKVYQPSIDTINAYKDADIDICLVKGEEVHAPDNETHVVNFGGKESVNSMFKGENSDDYYAEVNAIKDSLDIPVNINKFAYAANVWIANKIRMVNGLAIFPHPHWLANVYHVPDILSREIFKNNVFDAFELIGGQSLQENEPQIAFYNDMRASGYNMPIIGSSDSHGCMFTNNYLFNRFMTIVFAPYCQSEQLIKYIKKGFSVAIDDYDNNDYRIHGTYRLTNYTRFLMENYFPEHDELCFEEGIQMKKYICGNTQSKAALASLKGRTENFMKHCFGDV